MKALTLTQVKSPLELLERDALTPACGEVIVRVRAAALNRRDYWITQGMYPGIAPPVVLGSDGAGIVADCGEEVDPAWIGREVIINPGLNWGDRSTHQSSDFSILGLPKDGTFADEVAVPISQVYDKPQGFSWSEAAAIPLAGVTSYRALFTQGKIQPGQTVLITGIGGGVATFALQFAVAHAANVWVTSSSQQKIERAINVGARGGFDYTQDDWPKRFLKQAGPPDLIIDSAGGPAYASLVQLAAPGGRLVSYGATAGPPEKLDLFKVFWKQLHIVGTSMGSPDDFAKMLQFVERHGVRPIIDQELPLAEGNKAVAQMRSSPQFGKYVLAMD